MPTPPLVPLLHWHGGGAVRNHHHWDDGLVPDIYLFLTCQARVVSTISHWISAQPSGNVTSLKQNHRGPHSVMS
ncbi:unnamed protein product [Gadus morhua 'NCC']